MYDTMPAPIIAALALDIRNIVTLLCDRVKKNPRQHVLLIILYGHYYAAILLDYTLLPPPPPLMLLLAAGFFKMVVPVAIVTSAGITITTEMAISWGAMDMAPAMPVVGSLWRWIRRSAKREIDHGDDAQVRCGVVFIHCCCGGSTTAL